jgi:hypothetical protein
MDQVTTYLDEIFDDLKRTDEEKILTKTMINNYVKAKVLDQPEKKKYAADQIKDLMMIYSLKQVISIGEISECLNVMERDSLYDLVKSIDYDTREALSDSFKEQSSKEAYIIKLLIQSSIQKRIAEVLLDTLNKEDE